MHNQDIVIIGTGGMGREVLWLLNAHNMAETRNRFNILGFLTNIYSKRLRF